MSERKKHTARHKHTHAHSYTHTRTRTQTNQKLNDEQMNEKGIATCNFLHIFAMFIIEYDVDGME